MYRYNGRSINIQKTKHASVKKDTTKSDGARLIPHHMDYFHHRARYETSESETKSKKQ